MPLSMLITQIIKYLHQWNENKQREGDEFDSVGFNAPELSKLEWTISLHVDLFAGNKIHRKFIVRKSAFASLDGLQHYFLHFMKNRNLGQRFRLFFGRLLRIELCLLVLYFLFLLLLGDERLCYFLPSFLIIVDSMLILLLLLRGLALLLCILFRILLLHFKCLEIGILFRVQLKGKSLSGIVRIKVFYSRVTDGGILLLLLFRLRHCAKLF